MKMDDVAAAWNRGENKYRQEVLGQDRLPGYEQLDLLEQKPARGPKPHLRDRFHAFHIKHPAIYLALETAAMGYAKRGERTGIARLVEELRYDPRIAGVDSSSPFKINNSYRAFYARLLIEHHPSLADVLETRIQRG